MKHVQTKTVVEINMYEDQVKGFYSDRAILKKKLQEQNAMLKDTYENDAEYQTIDQKIKDLQRKKAARKDKINQEPSVALIKAKVKDLRSELKDKQQGLFDHLEAYVRNTKQNTIEISGVVKNIVPKYTLQ